MQTEKAFRLLDLPDLILRELPHHLARRDLKTLRLVCKALDAYVTPRLFSVMVLTPHEPHFTHLLTEFCVHDNGRLANHVRTLRFDCRYPADLSKPCFWNKSHLHRFHYDAYVLKRNIGVAKYHLIYLLCEFCKILDGVHFPRLRNVTICGDGLGNSDTGSDLQRSNPKEWNSNSPDGDGPNFYAYRFRCLTGRSIDAASRWVFDSSVERSKFYVTCLLLSVWATGRKIGSIDFENDQLRQLLQHATSIDSDDDDGATISTRTIGRCVARDFVSVLRNMGFLTDDDRDDADGEDESSYHHDVAQTARVSTMLAEVLVN